MQRPPFWQPFSHTAEGKRRGGPVSKPGNRSCWQHERGALTLAAVAAGVALRTRARVLRAAASVHTADGAGLSCGEEEEEEESGTTGAGR